MHPLSVFPNLLTYSFIAPCILRLAVGAFLVFTGLQRFKKPYKWMSVIYIVSGIFLFIGLYTQIAALFGFFIIGFDDWANKKVAPLTRDAVLLHTLSAIVLISLLFTGPGFFGLDLPL